MRRLLVALLPLIFLSGALAQVHYEVEAGEEDVLKNTTVSLECSSSCPGLTWTVSSDEEVLDVRDGREEIENYEILENKLKISGRRSFGQEKRVIEISTRIDRDAEEIHEGLYKRTIQFSGFPEKETTGIIRSEDLVSGRTGFGFDMSFSDGEMQFKGEGPVNVRMKFGDGYETRYFSFFGEEVDEAEMAYEVSVGTTGLVQDFERFPVAVHTNQSYNRKVNDWSAGEYVSGSIQIRNRENIGDEFIPVLAHEVVHGLNDRELTWDMTRSSYFDEGTGRYVEFLVKKKLYAEGEVELPPRELFGDEIKHRDGRTVYTIPPSGNRENLWEYYQQDQDQMKSWNAMETDPGMRDFGYAYSELIIKNYISRMNGSLLDLYDKIDVEKEVEDSDTKWNIYSEHLDMRPCDYSSHERFKSCLEEINSYDYPVYSAEPDRNNPQLDVKKLEVPNRTSESTFPPVTQVPEGEVTFGQFLKGFLDYIVNSLSSLFQALAASL